MDKIYKKLVCILGDKNVLKDEPMKNHTSFKIGGVADILVMPETEDDIIKAADLLKRENINYYIIGNGSNILVDDSGIRGVVVKLSKEFASVRTDGETITASAGTLLSNIAASALKANLTGFEFAAGIPGTLGGAVIMNAGAYGGEMKDVVKKVRYIDKDGNVREIDGIECDFSYRHSIFTKDDIILGADISLSKGNRNDILAVMNDLALRRREKQPLEYPSAGSTFKRPEGHFAGKLIEDAGLRGFKVGGAMISDKHCGFVINYDNATCTDVLTLIDEVRKKVKEYSGIELECEIKYLG